MTPEQKLTKLKQVLDLIKEDYVTPAQLNTVSSEFLKIVRHLEESLEKRYAALTEDGVNRLSLQAATEVREKIGEFKDIVSKLDTLQAAINTSEGLVEEVRNDLYTDISEARDRFERELSRVKTLIPTIPDLTHIEQGIEEVRNRLQNLPDTSPLSRELTGIREDVEEIPEKLKALSDRIEEIRIKAPAPGGMPTIRLSVNGEYVGPTRDLVFTGSGITSSVVNGVLTLVVSGGGSGSLSTIDPSSGAVDSSNQVFVFAEPPVYVIADGISYFDGKGYTLAGSTVTFTGDVIPTQYVVGLV